MRRERGPRGARGGWRGGVVAMAGEDRGASHAAFGTRGAHAGRVAAWYRPVTRRGRGRGATNGCVARVGQDETIFGREKEEERPHESGAPGQ